MKYKLINKTTKEETICTKVNVDGFDYYVIIDKIEEYYTKQFYIVNGVVYQATEHSIGMIVEKVIATNNFNIDAPKVIDEVDELALKYFKEDDDGYYSFQDVFSGFKKGYNKCKETNSFSEEDVLSIIQSLKDYTHESRNILGFDEREPKEFLDIWKEQKVETIYYE